MKYIVLSSLEVLLEDTYPAKLWNTVTEACAEAETMRDSGPSESYSVYKLVEVAIYPRR